jgi:hypothetical protein
MRSVFKTVTSAAFVIGGALLVAACGHSDNTAAADTNMTNMDTMDSSTGMSNDASALDATGNDANSMGSLSDTNDATPAGNAM